MVHCSSSSGDDRSAKIIFRHQKTSDRFARVLSKFANSSIQMRDTTALQAARDAKAAMNKAVAESLKQSMESIQNQPQPQHSTINHVPLSPPVYHLNPPLQRVDVYVR